MDKLQGNITDTIPTENLDTTETLEAVSDYKNKEKIMDSKQELVLKVLEKMINGELEAAPEILEILQDEENRKILQELLLYILDLDVDDSPFDEQEFDEQEFDEQEFDEQEFDEQEFDEQEFKEQQEKVIAVFKKHQRVILEIVVDVKERPVIYIYNNMFSVDEIALGQKIPPSIKSALEKAKAENILERAIKATCKISYSSPETKYCLRHIGTGWLIAKNIIVTNSHVASVFATGDDKKPSFKPQNEVYVDFISEYNIKKNISNPKSAQFKVESVLYAYSVLTPKTLWRYPDIAFLQLSDKSVISEEAPSAIALPDPISLLENPVGEGSDVAVIGYPGEPSSDDSQEIRKQEFAYNRDEFKTGVKVLQPGCIKAISGVWKDDRIAHDCTTFRGNSGSLLVDLKTGKAVGLHFGGKPYKPQDDFLQNYAVPARTIQEIAKREIDLHI